MQTMGCPLGPGLPPTYHARWSVHIEPPAASEEWYVQFTSRWRAYLLSLVDPSDPCVLGPCSAASSAPPVDVATSSPSSTVPSPPAEQPETPLVVTPSPALAPLAEDPPRGRPADHVGPPSKRRRMVPPARQSGAALPLLPAASSSIPSRRPRSTSIEPGAPPQKKQCTLASWLQPQRQRLPAHGRAAEGPPT